MNATERTTDIANTNRLRPAPSAPRGATADSTASEDEATRIDFQLLANSLPLDAFDLLEAAARLPETTAVEMMTLTGPGTRVLLSAFGVAQPASTRGSRHALVLTDRGRAFLSALAAGDVTRPPIRPIGPVNGWVPVRRVLPSKQQDLAAAAAEKPQRTGYYDLFVGDTDEDISGAPAATVKVVRDGQRAFVWKVAGSGSVCEQSSGTELDQVKPLELDLAGLVPPTAVREFLLVRPEDKD